MSLLIRFKLILLLIPFDQINISSLVLIIGKPLYVQLLFVLSNNICIVFCIDIVSVIFVAWVDCKAGVDV